MRGRRTDGQPTGSPRSPHQLVGSHGGLRDRHPDDDRSYQLRHYAAAERERRADRLAATLACDPACQLYRTEKARRAAVVSPVIAEARAAYQSSLSTARPRGRPRTNRSAS